MTLHDQTSFTCFLFGEGSLVIRCAELLLQAGHRIYGIISTDQQVYSWATQHQLPYIDHKSDWLATLRQQPFDYIFSIVNPFILSPEVLSLPKNFAINYHDAPLPKYAGVHATSWAIINQEHMHGITWHIMRPQVDAGDILVQHMVPIAADDTAQTLNAKCYEAAITAFTEMIMALAMGKVNPTPQNLHARTYFPRTQRPEAAGTLRWNQTAEHLAALVRALDFGPYPNPLGKPKLLLAGEGVVVSELKILSAPSTDPPGHIVRVTDESLEVATATQQIAISKVLTLDGEPLSIRDLAIRFGLRPGMQLPLVEPETGEQWSALASGLSRHEPFWLQQLTTLQAVTLPAPVSPYQSHSPEPMVMQPLVLPDGVVTGLASYAEQWSWGTTLLAAFGAFLARLSGLDQFDIGFQSAHLRQNAATHAPWFAPLVPFRFTFAHHLDFSSWCATVASQEKLVRSRRTYARDLTMRYPQLQRVKDLFVRGATFPITVIELKDNEEEIKDITSSVILAIGKQGHCAWIYASDNPDAAHITRIEQQFVTFLQHIVAYPRHQLSALSLLSPAEEEQVLREFNTTTRPYPHLCLHDLVALQAAQNPHAVALSYGDTHLTYAELDIRANQLAHAIRDYGISSEHRVGLCLERSPHLVIALLAVLKAGASYVPLDPDYPLERLHFMMHDAQIRLLLTQNSLRQRLTVTDAPVVCIDHVTLSLADQPITPPHVSVNPDQLAYIIYTSGSTGVPKGVMLSHRGVGNLAYAQAQAFALTPTSRVLQFASFSFDAALAEIAVTLVHGATLVLAPADDIVPGPNLIKLVQEQAITHITLPPSALSILASDALNTISTLVVAGEACPPELMRRWNSGRRFVNAYGPTEITVCGSLSICQPSDDRVTIGRPLANTSIYVLDKRLQPLPVGMVGELCMSGSGLAWGYIGRPDLTAERFVPNPFGSQPGERLYRSGDLARWRADGQLEFIGRADTMVKVRGYRIELGEIETVLQQHPSIQAGAVVVREDIPGDKRIVAYFVANSTPNTAQQLPVPLLRAFLQERLPAYMLPAQFVPLPALPLTPNGKVDRQALVALRTEGDHNHGNFAMPRTWMEELLTTMWQEALNMTQISIDDNFFELGGHSLMAAQIITRLRATLQENVPMAVHIQVAPTIASVARAVERYLINQAESSRVVPLLQQINQMTDGEVMLALYEATRLK